MYILLHSGHYRCTNRGLRRQETHPTGETGSGLSHIESSPLCLIFYCLFFKGSKSMKQGLGPFLTVVLGGENNHHKKERNNRKFYGLKNFVMSYFLKSYEVVGMCDFSFRLVCIIPDQRVWYSTLWCSCISLLSEGHIFHLLQSRGTITHDQQPLSIYCILFRLLNAWHHYKLTLPTTFWAQIIIVLTCQHCLSIARSK